MSDQNNGSQTAAVPIRIIVGLLLVQTVLLATHRGEFWPLSIYPMFSQAGRPWYRVMVTQGRPDTTRCRAVDELAVAGVDALKVPQNDLSALMGQLGPLPQTNLESLRAMFSATFEAQPSQSYTLWRVTGRLDAERRPEVLAQPVVTLTASVTEQLATTSCGLENPS